MRLRTYAGGRALPLSEALTGLEVETRGTGGAVLLAVAEFAPSDWQARRFTLYMDAGEARALAARLTTHADIIDGKGD